MEVESHNGGSGLLTLSNSLASGEPAADGVERLAKYFLGTRSASAQLRILAYELLSSSSAQHNEWDLALPGLVQELENKGGTPEVTCAALAALRSCPLSCIMKLIEKDGLMDRFGTLVAPGKGSSITREAIDTVRVLLGHRELIESIFRANGSPAVLSCYDSIETHVRSRDPMMASTAFCNLAELTCSARPELGSLRESLFKTSRSLQGYTSDIVGRIRGLPTAWKIRTVQALRQLVLAGGTDARLPVGIMREHLMAALLWGLQFGEEPFAGACCSCLASVAKNIEATSALAIPPQMLQLAISSCLSTIDCGGFGLEEACLNMAALQPSLSGDLLQAAATRLLQQCETQSDPGVRLMLLSQTWEPLLREDMKIFEHFFIKSLTESGALIQASDLPPVQSAGLVGQCLQGFASQGAASNRALAGLAPGPAARDRGFLSVAHVIPEPRGARTFPVELVACFMDAVKAVCTASWARLSGLERDGPEEALLRLSTIYVVLGALEVSRRNCLESPLLVKCGGLWLDTYSIARRLVTRGLRVHSAKGPGAAVFEHLASAKGKFNSMLNAVLRRVRHVSPVLRGRVLMASVKAVDLGQVPGTDAALWEQVAHSLRTCYEEDIQRDRVGPFDPEGTMMMRPNTAPTSEEVGPSVVPRCVRLLAFKAATGPTGSVSDIVRGMLWEIARVMSDADGPVSEDVRLAREAVWMLEKEVPRMDAESLETALELDDMVPEEDLLEQIRAGGKSQAAQGGSGGTGALAAPDSTGGAATELVATASSAGAEVRIVFSSVKEGAAATKLKIELWSYSPVPLSDVVLNLAPSPAAEDLLRAVQFKELVPSQRHVYILESRALDDLEKVTFNPRIGFAYPGADRGAGEGSGAPRATFSLPACTLEWKLARGAPAGF